ncbi:MAG: PAS domain-containing protein [Desulfamplus sp.]|nr:PAS domain-containing protein [Desulfamplus sp.]
MIVVTKKRRKILWQIVPPFLIITLLSLTAVTLHSTNVFKSFFLDNTEKELTTRAEFVKREFLARYPYFYDSEPNKCCNFIELNKDSNGVDSKGQSATNNIIDKHCKEIGKTTGTRVTIILPSGEVVGDSFGNINTMQNHKHRYEVALAIKDKKGVSIRKSETLGENMMYIALPVFRNNTEPQDSDILWIVRVAMSISSIEKQIKSIQQNIFVALLIAVVAATGASLFVARRITRPIEEMRVGADNFANGKLSTLLQLPESEELFQLALTMNQMALTLDEKIKTLEDRSMELEAVHSSMREGVIAIDPDERIITANQAASVMFGYPAQMIKGRNIHEISRHYELQKLINKALANPEPVEDDIVILGRDDRIYNVHSTSLCNASKVRIGTLIIFHDITRIRKLETMHKDFAANVSHELKTPLTSIKGFIETLESLIREQRADSCVENGQRDFKSEQAIKFIKIIQKNVERLIALINDLLALSRVEREEGTPVKLEPHDIAQVIQRAIVACKEISNSKDVFVEYISKDNCQPYLENIDESFENSYKDESEDYEDSRQEELEGESNFSSEESFRAFMDPILMEQALVNLLDNAIKYSSSGNKVTVACDKDEAGSIVISITDYGSGIGSEHLSRIFQRFYRVDKARSRDMGGTGLGLAIVKHIVKYHKGDISVASTLGKGSTFKITLPAVL